MPKVLQDFAQRGLRRRAIWVLEYGVRERKEEEEQQQNPRKKEKKNQNNQQTQRWPGTARYLEQSPGKSPLSGDLAGWKVWSCEQGDDL